MRNRANTGGLMTFMAAIILTLSIPTLALADTNLKPVCGAEGDPVLIMGEDFAENPTVKFDGVEAKIVKSSDERILCIVPDDTAIGSVDVTIDGDLADDEFTVLTDGAPVVYRLSAETVTAGTPIFLVGRRLRGGEVDFLDSAGTSQDTVKLLGGRRAAMLKVPTDLDAGTYTLKITNKDGVSTGDCSPELEVVEADDPALSSIEPEGQLPGRKIVIEGTDLSPVGPCKVVWTDSSGAETGALGYSNGYGKVVSRVPWKAETGETYDVVVVLRGGDETDTLEYEVGTPDAPSIVKLAPDSGPAGMLVRIIGENLLVGDKPEVTFDDGTDELAAKILGAHRGFKGRYDELLVLVPKDAADGEYDVTVTVGTETSKAATFTVEDQDLEVDGMRPDTAGKWVSPVYIKGAGFGPRDGKEIAVTFDDGSGKDALEGKVIFRSNNLLVVVPPGGWKKPLPKGKYEVRVIRDPDGTGDSVKAGTYTVK